MKVPLFILCLAVIYATSGIYAQEDVNLAEDGDENYNSNYPIISLERSLSRHRRANKLSCIPLPIPLPIEILKHPVWTAIETALKLFNLGNNILSGNELCPKVEKLSFSLIVKVTLDPIGTVKTILCHICSTIGGQGRALIRESLKRLWKFVRKSVIPALDTALGKLKKTGLLPPSIVAIIDICHAIYTVLKLLGYVG